MSTRARSLVAVVIATAGAIAAVVLMGQTPTKRTPPVRSLTPFFVTGGQVHGYVVLGAANVERLPYIRLPQIRVFLKSSSGVVVGGSATKTNAHGFFVVPKQLSGRYQICVDAAGYVANCEAKPISIVNGTLVLDHDLKIAPKAGFIHGEVRLKDGNQPFWESQFFRTFEETKVTLNDEKGNVVAGPVLANSLGLYVVPNVVANGAALTVTAAYAGSAATVGVIAD